MQRSLITEKYLIMEVGFNSFVVDHEIRVNSPENSEESPPSTVFFDIKTTSTSSPKRRRGTQKRVVSVPIRDVEGSRLKGETNSPPSDSWAWRKYGQKPIKGSPYPRGYYRCSSSKGCPARKQVERSRSDPTMVVVTYSSEHNHAWPTSRNNNHHHHNNSTISPPPAATITTATEATISTTNIDQVEDISVFTRQTEPNSDEKFTNLEVGPGGPFVSATDQYGWFSDLESTSSRMLESPLMAADIVGDADMAMIFSIREDDESFFADLGELPECATVFRQREVEREEHRRRQCNLASWCGTTR